MELIELVKKAQTGDADAQGALYEAVYRRVYYLALRLTKNPEDAQDAAQDTFISAFQSLPNLQNPNAFEGWLFQIAANKCKNRLTRAHDTEELPEGFDETEPDPAEDLIPEDALQSEEKRRLILNIIDDLPAAQRECVMLFYYSELSVKQIAETLDCSEGTVKSRLNYARQKIRDGILETEARDGIRLHVLVPFGLLLAKDLELGTAGMAAAALGGTGAAAAGAGSGSTAGAAGTAKAGLLATVKAKVIAGVTAAAVAVGGIAFVAVGMPSPIRFSDPTFEQNVRVMLDKPSGSIYSEDFGAHVSLTVYDDGMALTQRYDTESAANPGTVPVASLADLAQIPAITHLYYESSNTELLLTLGENPNLLTAHIYRSDRNRESQPPLTDLSWLAGLPNLNWLFVLPSAGTDLAPIRACTKLQHLTVGVSGQVALDLTGLEKLSFLSIFGRDATLTMSASADLPALRVLQCSPQPQDFASFLAHTPSLEVVDLELRTISSDSLTAFGLLPQLRAARVMPLVDGSLDLQSLSACPKLEILNIAGPNSYVNAPSGLPVELEPEVGERSLFRQIYMETLEQVFRTME